MGYAKFYKEGKKNSYLLVIKKKLSKSLCIEHVKI